MPGRSGGSKGSILPNDVLPYGRHLIEEDDIAAVADVMRSDFLTTGPAVERFETALARQVAAPHAVVCGTGTAALHLAALVLGLGPEDVSIVPSLTFVATANASRFCGANVVVADVDPETGLMTPETLDDAVRRADGRAKAVFNVHLNGQVGDVVAIEKMARQHGLAIVDDACHAIGTTYRHDGRRHVVGACDHADLTVFSFHPVKTIAMGEGGAVTCRDDALGERLRLFRSHGIERDPARFVQDDEAVDAEGLSNPWYYEQQVLGFNYRANDIQCALGLSQLSKIDRLVHRRRELATRYDAALAPLAEVVRPIRRTPGCEAAWHIYVVAIDFERIGRSRAWVMRRLKERGILTQVHYIPVHRQPYYRPQVSWPLPGADAYYAKALTLPLFPGMADEDVDRVVGALAELLKN